MSAKQADKKRVPAARAPRGIPAPLLFDAAVVVLTLVCFWPLTRFYFAQDDFILLEQASRGFGAAVGGFFGAHPGQFRPLTKGLYFVITWPLLGLNPVAFHALSILLHAANAILLAVLLRRMGISAVVSRFVAALFAFNVGYLEAVAWVSCVQQLIGNLFMLLSLIYGIDALEGRSTRRRVASSVFLVLALASYEQTLATPAVLLGWYAMRHGVRAGISAARTRLWEQPAILLMYLLFTLGVRGVPDSGPYAMSLGLHVLDNLRTYTGLAFSLWIVFPAYGLPGGFTPSHAVLIVIIGYLAYRRRFAEIAFGLGTFLALLAPVLFVRDHTHSFHLYVPAVGTWFLAAVMLEDVLSRVRVRAEQSVRYGLAAVAVLVCAVSTVVVRANTTAVVSEDFPMPRSFVLRRAVLAQRMCDDILERSTLADRPGRMILVYLHPEYRANWLNVHSALGQGSAVRLVLRSPDLDVLFVPPAEFPPSDDPNIEVMVYTEVGRCYSAAEVEEARRRAARMQGGAGAPADTTTVVVPPGE
jgi:hypothetical protein